MLHGDCRSYKVALIADAIANDDSGAVLGALVERDFGVIVPPPHDFALTTIASTIEYIVDDLADYARNGYAVFAIGSSELPQNGYWGDLVTAELNRRGLVDAIPVIDLAFAGDPVAAVAAVVDA